MNTAGTVPLRLPVNDVLGLSSNPAEETPDVGQVNGGQVNFALPINERLIVQS